MRLFERVALPLLAVGALILAAGCAVQVREAPAAPLAVGATATAMMAAPDGTAMGTVTLTQGPHGVLIAADVTGLVPGGHGFHIHETGSCTPDFAAAGDHFAPKGLEHGYENEAGFHAGDLPNIYAAADGTARADFFTRDVTLTAGLTHSLFDEDGSAIIIHEKPDTYGEDAGAGGRVACGVIKRD